MSPELIQEATEALRGLMRERVMTDVTAKHASTYWIDKADELTRAVVDALLAAGWVPPEEAEAEKARHAATLSSREMWMQRASELRREYAELFEHHRAEELAGCTYRLDEHDNPTGVCQVALEAYAGALVWQRTAEQAEARVRELEASWVPPEKLEDARVLIWGALYTDGAHHKQWFLEQITLRLGVALPNREDYEHGIPS